MADLLRPVVGAAARSATRHAPGPAPHRRLAAAAMEECWSDWEEDEEEAVRRARLGAVPKRRPRRSPPGGVQWVVMGRSAPQKHAHAARLVEELTMPYISTGELVRQELSPASRLYRKIANSVNEGRLVPEDINLGC